MHSFRHRFISLVYRRAIPDVPVYKYRLITCDDGGNDSVICHCNIPSGETAFQGISGVNIPDSVCDVRISAK